MKSYVLFVIFFLISLFNFSQNSFKAGSYTTNDGKLVEGYIKSKGFDLSPTAFNFRFSLEAPSQKLEIADVVEVVIDNDSRWIRKTVLVDLNADNLNLIENQKEVTTELRTVFLQVLVSGKYSLYQYKQELNSRFYVGDPFDKIKLLTYQKFINSDNQVRELKAYKNDVARVLNCTSDELLDKNRKLSYTRKSLMNYMEEYYKCIQQPIDYIYKPEKSLIKNVYLNLGFRNYTTTISSSDSRFNVDFGTETIFQAGIELEVIIPASNNKFGIFIAPTYLSDSYSEKSIVDSDRIAVARYTAFEIPVGVRYFVFLSPRTKLYANAGFAGRVASELFVRGRSSSRFGRFNFNPLFGGIGFQVNNKIKAEIRYYNSKVIEDDADIMKFRNLSFSLGYKLF